MGSGCVKTFGAIRLVRKQSEFRVSTHVLAWLNSQASTDFTYGRALQRIIWAFTQPGSLTAVRDRLLSTHSGQEVVLLQVARYLDNLDMYL